ncbi:MAG: zinc-binding dehydrogenase, partial [Candidatus Humimicrobiaceae bacterium]
EKSSDVNIRPGHEACGVVEKLGEGISEDEIKIGDRVAIYLGIGCGHCVYCRQGWNILCPTWKCLGFDIDGGHAELIKVPVQNCLLMPDELSFVEGALSTDKFGGLYDACKSLCVSGKDTVAIFGMGPMGQMGIAAGKALGATIIAVDILDSRLELAKKAGAEYTINSKIKNAVEEIRKITKGVGADKAIDCSGNPKAQNDALDCVKKMGSAAFVGESKATQFNPSEQWLRKKLMVVGSWYFPTWEYPEIADLIVSKKLHLDKFVTNIFSLEDAPKAYELFDEYETGIVVFTD